MQGDILAKGEARPVLGAARRAFGQSQNSRVDKIISVAAAIALTLTPTFAQAQQLPTGGSLAAGSATIGTPRNGTLDINQSSNRAVINWNSFSIGRGGTVNFHQPSSSSATLNRVTGNTPSSIAGTINAPGTVLLVNPNGIAISKSGVVNVGSFAASTLDIKDKDFMSGNYTFSGKGASAAVTNAGRINVSDGGFAALLGGHVANDGVISARLGRVGLGSGELITLDLAGDGFLSVGVPTSDLGKLVGEDGKPLVSNKGKISADGGIVYLSAATAAGILRDAVNVPGVIRANSVGTRNGRIVIGGSIGGSVHVGGKLAANGGRKGSGGSIAVSGARVSVSGKVSAKGKKGGNVKLTASQSVDVSGKVAATGRSGNGGVVIVTADQVTLGDKAKLDASGATGGLLLIGGDYQGGNGATKFSIEVIKNALTTSVAAGATLTADGTGGAGGKIVVWSDDHTTFAGAISASGSTTGGLAEVSGHRLLDFTGTANLIGPDGNGTLLLDPRNVVISSGTTTGGALSGGTFTPSADDSILNVTTLNNALASGNVIVTTGNSGSQDGDITVNGVISWTNNNSLTLSAYRNIVINSGPQQFGSGQFVLRADNTGTGVGTVTIGAGHNISSNGTVSIYYNPTGDSATVNSTKYTAGSQTDYSGLVSSGATLKTYMLVNNVFDLQNMGNNLSGSYALGRDIDATATSSWNAGAGFAPVGTGGNAFTGVFDGQQHVISGLVINRPGTAYVGLFGDVGNATIGNLGFVGGSVSGGYAGALAGRVYASSASISQVYSDLTVAGSLAAGGLIGLAQSSSAGSGLLITRSYASGNVSVTTTYAGGGGLVGSASVASGGAISLVQTYATGSVSAASGSSIGGLVGTNYGATISQSYASGKINAGSGTNSGGLVGINSSGSVTTSYWDRTASGQAQGTAGNGGTFSASGVTSAQAILQSSYVGWDFTNTWYMANGSTRPFLQMEASTGTIYNAHQLQLIGMNATTLARSYTLASDINLGAALSNPSDMWGSAGFVPIGDSSTPFSGSFNGQGHVITGLTINRPTTNNVGLFGYVLNNTISNVGLVGGSVTGQYQVGALVGTLLSNGPAASISQSYADVTVTGAQTVGGLIGEIQTVTSGSVSVTSSYASGDVAVTTQSVAGGLIGDTSPSGGGTISIAQTYAVGDVTGYAVGGLIGTNGLGSSVTQSYASGKLNGTGGIAGGFVVNNYGVISSSYWDTTTTGSAAGFFFNAGTFSATGLTSAQARTQSSYSGWDFANTWYMVDGDTRPFLRSEYSTTIHNAHQLQLVGMNTTTLAASYKVANDINLGASLSNSSDMWGSAGWMPIGSPGTEFNGTFDGGYHIITGLTINRPTTNYVGLFGATWTATISRVGLTGVNIVGKDLVGALGGNISGSVSDSFATGSVSGGWEVGGLIGEADDFASTGAQNTRLYANVAVSASGGQGGGLIGQNNIPLSQAYAAGAVTGIPGIAGLIGFNGSPQSPVTSSYYDTTTSGSSSGAGTAQTTAQLQAALPAGFDSNWGIIAGQSYAYLKGFYGSATPQVISGTAYKDAGITAASGGVVSALVNGVSAGTASVGANGYYNILIAPNSIVANSQVAAYTTGVTGGMAYQQNVAAGSISGFNINGTYLTETSAVSTLSAVSAGLATAIGANNVSTTYANRLIVATGSAFSIDQSLSLTGNMLVQASGALSIANGTTLTAGGSGNAIVLADGTTFTNNAGAGALSLPGGGRFLIYSQNPANDNVNGLTGGTIYSETYAANPPSSIGASGNQFIYASGPPLITLTYTVAGASSTYGNLATPGAATLSGNPAGVTAVVSIYDSSNNLITLSASTPAGTYTEKVTGLTGANAGQYQIAASGNTDGVLIINKATLTYTADTSSRVYGNANGAFSGTVTGFVNGETQASATTGTLGWSSTATSSSNVGNYAITGGGLSAANYTFVQAGANNTALSVTPRTLFITATTLSKAYDKNAGSDPALTYSSAGLLPGDTLTGALTRDPGQNVGTYAITQGTLANSNYAITYTGANFTITPRNLFITATTLSKIYDNNAATDPALTYSSGGLVPGDTLSGSLTRVAGQNAGTYAITQGSLANSNYAINFTGANFTITPRNLFITATTLSKGYDNNPATDPALTYSSGGLVPGDTLSGALTRAAGQNAGTYAITQGSLANSNYAITYTGANFTITPRTVFVSATTLSKVYDNDPSTDPALTYSSAGLISGDTLSGSLTRAAGQNAGSYAITQGTLTASSNYTLSYTGANLTISQRPLTVMATAQSKTYGGADPALTYSTVNLVNGDSLTGALTRAAGENAGTYAISQGTLTASSNYIVFFNGANLTINKATLTYTADASSRVYGNANGTFSGTLTGFVNGDTQASATSGTLGWSSTATSSSNVGNYAITGGGLTAANYSFVQASANNAALSITPRPLTVTATAQSKTYGDTDPTLTYSSTGLIGGDSLTGALTRAAGLNVGTYAITQGTLAASSNYALSFTGANLTITPRTLLVTATTLSKVYDNTAVSDPALTYSSAGLLPGDTLSGALTRAAGQNAGTYAITQGSLANSNYAINFTGADFTITPRNLFITATTLSKTYDNNALTDPALTYSSGGLVPGDTLTGALTRAAGENAGVYAITQGTLTASSNYDLHFTGANLTISPRNLSVVATALSKTYDNNPLTDPALTYSTGGLVPGDSLTGALTRAAGQNAGTYAITQGTLTASSNYTLNFTGANLTISPRTLLVTATTLNKTYDNNPLTDPALTYSSSGLVSGDALSGALTRAAGQNAGTYAIGQGTLAASSNYVVNFTGANLTIDPRPVNVTATPVFKTYGGNDPALTYLVYGLLPGDSLSGTLTRAAGENAGTYAITQGTLAASSNYAMNFTGGNLTINKAGLYVNVVSIGKTYDGTAFSGGSVNYGGFVNGDNASALGGTLTFSGTAQGAVNAGSYTLNASGLTSQNYSFVYVNGAVTILPKALTYTAVNTSSTYGATPGPIPVVLSGVVGSDVVTATVAVYSGATPITPAATTPAGTYTEKVTGLGGSVAANYVIASSGNRDGTLTINKANLTVTTSDAGKTYDGLAYSGGNGVSYSGFVNGENASVLGGTLGYTGTSQGAVNAGGYTLTAAGLTSSNYDITYTSANLTIAPRPLSVTADAQGKTYGNADPSLTYGVTAGNLVGSDTLSGALSRAAGENVGLYAIGQGSLTAGSNYTLTFNSANLTITPRSITVAADNLSKAYGTPDPVLTFAVNGVGGAAGLANGDTSAGVFTGALARAPGETVLGGPYAINQGSLAANSNYVISGFTPGQLTIAPASVTATALLIGTVSKVYDGTLTATVDASNFSLTGIQSADVANVSVAASAASYDTVNVGTNKTVTATGLTLTGSAASNYLLSSTTAQANVGTVTARPITVTADAQSKTYGDADPSLTYGLTAGNLVGSDTLSGALSRAAGENVGLYAIGQGGLTAGSNYALTYVGANLGITARPITVTADAQSKTYGDADPSLTYGLTAGNLVGSDTLSGALSRAAGENVGLYAIGQGGLTAGSNYALTYVGANLNVTARPITVTADAQSKTYGDADPSLTYGLTSGNLVGSDTLSGALSRAAGENVGLYAIGQGGLSAGSNYALTYVGANLGITARPITVTADAQSKTYGDADPSLTYGLTAGNLVGSDTLSGALSRAAGENVGLYAIGQGGLSAGSNYALTYVGANLGITARPITVTADAQSKTYGDADPSLTYGLTSGNLVGSDTLSGALSRTSGENVGLYAIGQGGLSAGSNYALTYVGANLGITARPITVTADAQSKTYGDADPSLTYGLTAGNLVGSDTLSGALSRAAGENVGVYGINQGGLTAGGNYALTYVGANLGITARPITVTADAQSKIYGDADPSLTYGLTAGNLVGSDTLSGALSRASGENVGLYAIGQGGLTAGGNYALTYVGANLGITARPITVTADAQSKTYGDADPSLTYGLTAGNLVGSDTLSGALTRAAGENVGLYAIGQGGLTAGSNYALTYVGANLGITARPITVTADAQNKTYGDADPSLTYGLTAGNLVGSDTLSGALTRAAGENVGLYAIGQGGLTAGSNYALTYVGANLGITARPITVTADAQSKTYGDADPSLTYGLTAGNLVGSDTLSGALSRASGENVGLYAIGQGGLSAGSNYALTYVGANLGITARPITVTADAQSKTYGDADPSLTYGLTAGNLVGSDTLTGALSRAAGENVGLYAINQGGLTAGSNYALTYVGANLGITARPITVTADAQSKTYGDADPSLTYGLTAGNLVGSDTLSGALSRASGENVGVYGINQGGLTAGSNYALTYVGANLGITARPITVTADAQSKTYGDADPSLTYGLTAGNLVGSDTLSGALSRASGENVGLYAIGQGGLSAGSNYALTYVGANLGITARPITVTADAQSKTYGDADPSLTYGLTAGNLVGSDTLSGALSRASGENVGLYAIGQGGLTAGGNYALTYVGANLGITARPITVTADAQSKTYGDADPSLTYGLTAGNLVGSDTLSGALSRASGENVGLYGINQGGLTAGSNYALTYVGANLGITARPITVTADAQSKTYGDADPSLTYGLTSGNLVGSDTLSGALSRAAGESAGDYAILQGTLAASSNYDLSYVGATLSILSPPPGTTPVAGSDTPTRSSDYATSQYQAASAGSPVSVVNVSFQPSSNAAAPRIGIVGGSSTGATANPTQPNTGNVASTTTTPDASQNIEPGSGPNSLFPPISQFDKTQYAGNELPPFAPQAYQATVLAMIARAEANNRQEPKIDLLWRDGTSAWTNFNDSVGKQITFSDGNGSKRTPAGDNGFAFVNGVTDIAALLQRGPVMLGGAKPAGSAAAVWLLAVEITADGKGIVANDPITGGQVVLAYDPTTKTVGNVIELIDPTTKKTTGIGDAAPELGAGDIKVPTEAWDELKAFEPAAYFAVTL